MQVSATIILLAIVVEQVTNIIKSAFPAVQKQWCQVVAMVVGIALCLGTRVGILAELNIPVAYPVIDYVISGLLISRGSNLVHDMFQGVNNFVESRKTKG